jgi:multidrug efflux system outer membrane protein
MRTPLVALAAALAAGCTMIPKYDRPQPPVPPAWPEGALPAGTAPPAAAPGPGGSIAAETRWEDFFTDRRLAGVIALALENNRDLRVATLAVEKVRALYRIQRSALFPSVGVLAQGERFRIPGNETDEGVPRTTSSYSVNLGTTGWEIDLFGRVRSLKAAAFEQYLASGDARRAAQISLVAAVAVEWLALAADTESLELARGTLEAQQVSYDLIRKSRDAGIASDLDLRQAETQVETARAALAAFTGQVAADRAALDVLAGAPVPADLLPERLAEVEGGRLLAPGLPSEVLLERPDVLEAEHRLKGANASIGAARAAFFPRISLTAAVGTMSSELSGLFASGSGTWTFVPQVVAPLFTGGFNRANLDSAKIDRDIAVARYEKAIQSAFAEVTSGLALRTTLVAQREAQQALVDALAETHRLAEARYKAGIDSYLVVLVAQRALFAGQQVLIGVRFAEQANLVTLYKVLGGGA